MSEVFTEVGKLGTMIHLGFFLKRKSATPGVIFQYLILKRRLCAFEEKNKFGIGFVPKLMTVLESGNWCKEGEILSYHLSIILSQESLLIC